ncbi:glycosyl transferase group 1 [Sulfuricurvum kujiense DSM 16994]|uniref:Glycosyl transferase group 1 n=1 Tax=Sulfuricurvum kujiense (strain ATCC BAA-921 / DSM 16994 / JCM 11577 / YK-1) TaxID=709032 RepID=E4TYC4_SULKY|nr:glycosyltransferase family 4 protein [Sulfuricurvum kujiense]ADR35069.1 glycosyl transferase group 1 [Sulfuricurvum kujiense DSM 16994]
MSKKKISIVLTVPLSIETWFKGQPRYLSDFYDIELITSYSESIEKIKAYENVSITIVDFTRQINPLKDLAVLFSLWRHFRLRKPDMVYTITPKAGLLGMMAAWLARVPLRVHLIVGLAYMGSSNKRRMLLKAIEKITYFFATNLYSNSLNLIEIIRKELTSKKVNVIGYGSVNGVDTAHFNDTFTSEEKFSLRHNLRIDRDDFLLLFTGRIVADKGINELIAAFEHLALIHPKIRLLLVGDYEHELDPIHPDTFELITVHSRISVIPFQSDIRPYFCIADVLVLPSYREGLPNVLIEAGSCGLPLIATDINGCNEVIIEGDNGLLVEPKSISHLIDGIEKLVDSPDLYAALKKNARKSILKRYDQNVFWEALHGEFEHLFNSKSDTVRHV